MIKLLITADDFTGALDTGVKFANKGISTVITADPDIDLSKIEDVDVLVVATESRHESAKTAYEKVKYVMRRAAKAGVRYFYKKTDSVMRGNIGAEFDAAIDGTGERKIMFFPALPSMGRIVKDGVYYVDGKPLHETHFSKDPFDPVTSSVVKEVIAKSTDRDIMSVSKADGVSISECGASVLVFDAQSDDDFYAAANVLKKQGFLTLTAGCSGFAEVLADSLDFNRKKTAAPRIDTGVIIISGSVNTVTLSQTKFARENGIYEMCLTPEQKLCPDFTDTHEGKIFLNQAAAAYKNEGTIIIESARTIADMEMTDKTALKMGMSEKDTMQRTAMTTASIAKHLTYDLLPGALVVFGGDTLIEIMRRMGVCALSPICEIEPGIVLSKPVSDSTREFYIVSKSGGFGEKNVILSIIKFLKGHF